MEIFYYIKYSSINKKAWDSCITHALNSEFYGFSWYLDLVCQEWDAIVNKDYTTVMPLPVSLKNPEFVEINVPYLLNRLGVYSICEVNEELLAQIVNTIPDTFRKVTVPFNKYNFFDEKKVKSKNQLFFELDLIHSYAYLRKNYLHKSIENITIGIQSKLTVRKSIGMQDFWSFFLNSEFKNNKMFTISTQETLQRTISRLLQRRMGEIYGVYNAFNTLISTAVFVWDREKVYLMALSNSDDDDGIKSFYSLIDYFIQVHAEKNLTLVLETNQAFHENLYRNFGALACKNYVLNIDRRSWFSKKVGYG